MMDRRTFLSLTAYVASGFSRTAPVAIDLPAIERARVLGAARRYLGERPITITSASSPRNAGGRHDFFSEGDYGWPDPANPGGPYIQRDGMTNPGNFVAHRKAMIRLSVQVPALAAAWLLTKDRRFAEHAARHVRAWFVDEKARMNPNLQYAQAIHGRFTGGAHDVMYFDQWPVRHPSLLFAGLAFDNAQYVDLWRRLNPDPTEDEIVRNYFIRQPLLWTTPRES